MRSIISIILLLFVAVSLEAYSKKVILSTLDNKADADKLFDKLDLSSSFKELRMFAKQHNLKISSRASGSSYILVIEPFKDKALVDKALALVRPKFKDAFVFDYVPVKQENSMVVDATKKNLLYVDKTREEKKQLEKEKNKKVIKSVDKQASKLPKDSKLADNSEFVSAKKVFDLKKYNESYDLFSKLFLKNMSNPNVNFYLGQSAYNLKKYEEALSAYERILIIDEDAHRAKLEMARCYQQLGLPKKAKKTLLEVRDKVPPNVQKNVDLYLANIEKQRKKHTFGGALILGLNYDTNIYGVTVDNALSDKIPDFTLNNRASKSWAHQEVVAANYAYLKSETLKYKLDSVLFNKSIFSYHDMDLNLIQITPAVSVVYNKNLIVDYSIFANKIWLSKNPLMTNLGINPKFKYKYSPKLLLNGAFKFQDQKNSSPNGNRDNYTYSLELKAQHLYSKELTFDVKTKLDFVREKNSAEIGDLNEVAYNLYELTLSANYKYTPKIMIAPKLTTYKKYYRDVSISPLTGLYLYKRSDDEYQIWLSGTYIYSKKMLFTCEYVHSKHGSNYADNKFSKDTLSANVIVPF